MFDQRGYKKQRSSAAAIRVSGVLHCFGRNFCIRCPIWANEHFSETAERDEARHNPGTLVEVISKVFFGIFRGILRPFRPPNGLSKFSGQIWILTKDEFEADFSGAIIVDVLYYDS